MNWQEHLFDKLQQESAEVIQASSKLSTFGHDSIVPGKGITNEEDLIGEIHDVLAIVDMLHENGMLNFQFDPEKIKAKKKKVIHFAKMMGVLAGEPELTHPTLYPSGGFTNVGFSARLEESLPQLVQKA